MKHRYFLALAFVSFFATAEVIPDKPHIYVEGSGEIKVAPDQMQMSVRISATNLDVEIAKADIDAKSSTLIDSMFALGIARTDVATTALRISPQYEFENGKRIFSGTEASRQIDITLRDLGKYADFMAAVVNAKITETIDTHFKTSNARSLLDQASVAALADARTRATALAASQGKRLGEIYSISEFQTRSDENTLMYSKRKIVGESADSVTVSASRKAEPFEPGTMTATATVYVVFLLK